MNTTTIEEIRYITSQKHIIRQWNPFNKLTAIILAFSLSFLSSAVIRADWTCAEKQQQIWIDQQNVAYNLLAATAAAGVYALALAATYATAGLAALTIGAAAVAYAATLGLYNTSLQQLRIDEAKPCCS